MSKTRGYCFTLNNWSEEEREGIKLIECKYMCFQEEVAPTTLTPHIQGYIYFEGARHFNAVKKLIPRAYFAVAKGNTEQNKAYCSKPGGVNFFEKGIHTNQGKRNDINHVANEIAKGTSMDEIAQENPVAYIRYHRGFKELASTYVGKRDFKTDVFWYWGATGTGKSYSAHQQAPDSYYKMGGNKWWDGYTGQSDVIIDDFRGDLCPFHELLRLFDRYPHRVEYKGGSINFIARRIFVTCNKPPEAVYQGRTEEDIGQLLRRITEVKHFDQAFVPPIPEDVEFDMSVFDEIEI